MKYSIIISLLLVLGTTFCLRSQVSVNSDGSPPDSSAMFDIKSTEMGFLPPRMTEVEKFRINNPAEGLIIYNTSSNSLEVFNGSTWMSIGSNGLSMDPLNHQLAVGGAGTEAAYSVIQTADGGFLVGGVTNSFGAGASDFYAVKLKADFTLDNNFGTGGSIVFGGSGAEDLWSVVQAPGGGYVLGGWTQSYGQGGYDFYTVKLTAAGVADNTYGSNGTRVVGEAHNDRCYCMRGVSDGGYILVGYHTVPATTFLEGYVVKLTGSGALDNGFGTNGCLKVGGSGNEAFRSVRETADGGFIVAGYTSTFDVGGNDLYVVKLTGSGTLDNAFGVNGTFVVGGSGDDYAFDVMQAADDSYLVFGQTTSFGAGGSDYYLVKLTVSGSLDNSFGINGTLTLGGSGNEVSRVLLLTTEGDYLLGGYTNSFGAGGNDMYIVKVSSTGVLDDTFGTNGTLTIGGTGDDLLNSMCLLEEGGYFLVGSTSSFGVTSQEMYLVRINIAGGTCGYAGSGGGISGHGGTVGSGGTVTYGGSVGSGGSASSGGTLTIICN